MKFHCLKIFQSKFEIITPTGYIDVWNFFYFLRLFSKLLVSILFIYWFALSLEEIAFKIKFLYCFLSTWKVLFFDTNIFQTFRSWVDCQMMLLAYVVRGHSRNATPSFWILEPINIKFLPKICFKKCYAHGNWF